MTDASGPSSASAVKMGVINVATSPNPIAAAEASSTGPGLSRADAEKRSKRFAVKTAIIGSVGGLLFGFDLGVVAGALTQLRDEFQLDAQERGLVVSILLLGSVVGAVFGGYATDKYGRRTMIVRTDMTFIVGSLAIALAPSFPVLLAGRFVVGIGVSVSAIADVAYLTEVAPTRYRGAVVSMNELMISVSGEEPHAAHAPHHHPPRVRSPP